MESILLAREADERSLIEGRTFDNALILGPAIIAPLERFEMRECTWEGADIDSLFIEVSEGRTLVGVIGLNDVTFTRCRFQNVGVIGPRRTIEFLRTGISGTDVKIGDTD